MSGNQLVRVRDNQKTFRAGVNFKALPRDMQARVDAARDDPELLDIRGDIAYVMAAINERAELAEEGGGPGVWLDLKKTYAAAEKARRVADRAKDPALLQQFWELFEAMGAIIEDEGNRTKETEATIRLIQTRANLIKQHEDIRLTRAHTLNAEQALALVWAVIEQVKANVTDAEQMRRISSGVVGVLNGYQELFETPSEGVVDGEVVGELTENGETPTGDRLHGAEPACYPQ